MKKAINLLFFLFALNLVLFSCTIQDDLNESTDTIATDPNPNKDTDPPIDEPND